MSEKVRVRFAPSPTGMLHIGGLRTALFNYLFARHHGGRFILRIEDTDQARYVADAEADITESLKWAGLEYDEGPGKENADKKWSGKEGPDKEGPDKEGSGKENADKKGPGKEGLDKDGSDKEEQGKAGSDREESGNDWVNKAGPYGPYRQSERSEIYARYARELVEGENAYYAFDTPEEIDEMRERLQKSGNQAPKYDAVTRRMMKNSLTLSKDEVQRRLDSGEPWIIRLKVPETGSVHVEDLIRGHVTFECEGIDDQVLLKSDGLPTYHLANVVDDHLMDITHVIRGEEWLSSVPKHILLYQYLGWDPPKMAHLPLIMSPKGGKLSKRNADALGIPVNVRDYIRDGYEPEAVVNFLAYLGWSTGDDREILTPEEMATEFSLERVSKSGAIFDLKKLQWYNEHYFRGRPDSQLVPGIRSVAEREGYTGHSDEFLEAVVRLMKERCVRLPEVVEQGPFFFEAPENYDEPTVKKAWKENTGKLLDEFRDELSAMNGEFDAASIKAALTSVVEKNETGFGKLMLPVRLAITGTGSGPDLFETMALLGKEEVIERLIKAAEKLSYG